MNRSEYLMTQAASECCEVAHRITKAMHFGVDEKQPGQDLTNAKRIVGEFIDLLAVMEMLESECLIKMPNASDLAFWKEAKKAQVEKSMGYAKECGTLEDDQ
jgi:hypothetical protein